MRQLKQLVDCIIETKAQTNKVEEIAANDLTDANLAAIRRLLPRNVSSENQAHDIGVIEAANCYKIAQLKNTTVGVLITFVENRLMSKPK